MILRTVPRAAVVAAGIFLTLGIARLDGAPVEPAPVVIGAPAAPSLGVEYGAGYGTGYGVGSVAAVPPSDVFSQSATAVAADGVAAIPLPPSAYPGMVGLATAALSVWRYRRRRR